MYPLDKRMIKLDYEGIRKFRVVWLITLVTTTLILGIYYLHPANIGWSKNEDFSLINLVQFIFIDQYLIELVTTSIIIWGLIKYINFFRINKLLLSWQGILQFIGRFIPFFILVYFITAPITIGLRFIYHSLIHGRTISDYWESYFFINFNLYIIYLFPLTISSLMLLGWVIMTSAKSSVLSDDEAEFKDIQLTVKSASGEKIISSKSIEWIKREGRKYVVKSDNTLYQTNKNLSELEAELDVNFMSVNRSTLINLSFFDEYSFWENEKYILRMKCGENFNITRNRLKLLKRRLQEYRNIT